MRRIPAIAIAIIVALSFIPWIRHQHRFWLIIAVSVLVLFCLLAIVGLGRLASQLNKPRHQDQLIWSRVRRFSVGIVPVLALILTLPHFIATSSSVYKLAVLTAHNSPRFVNALGAPVSEGWFSEGKEVWKTSAEIEIPVRGSFQEGTLVAATVWVQGHWELTKLELHLKGTSQQIELLSR